MIKKAFLKDFFLVLLYPAGILLFLVFLFAVAYYTDFIPHNHYVKGDINNIVYAEPTQEAKDFDVEGFVNSLPSVEYKKVDYPIKETHTYEFNGYVLTVDIPEGFDVYELEHKPEVINSTSIEDSCEYIGGMSTYCDGPEGGIFKGAFEQSGSILCIDSGDKSCGADGVRIWPYKSKYKGISLRDVYMRSSGYKQTKYVLNDIFFAGTSNEYNSSMGALISDQQGIGVSSGFYSSNFSKDLYFSILDSIKIRKK